MRRVVLLGVCALALWSGGRGHGVAAQERGRIDFHLGAGSCAAQACHGGTVAPHDAHTVWMGQDRHSRAYESLGGEVGQAIAARLGLGDARKARACLACHGTDPVRFPDRARTFDERDGVSCELCHGAAERWLGPHAAPDWEEQDKRALGFLDLATPAARAAACVECHVGGGDRRVDHAMYAAGHPPVVFEAAAFLAAMPPHWREERDVTAATWLEGARASGLAQVARIEGADPPAKPDFALYDCYSCHHALGSANPYAAHPPRERLGEPAWDLSHADAVAIAAGKPPPESPAAARALLEGPPPQVTAENVDSWLAQVEAGEVRAPYLRMLQLAWAARALSPARGRPEFSAAWEKVRAALDPRLGAYDPAACARLVRTLLR